MKSNVITLSVSIIFKYSDCLCSGQDCFQDCRHFFLYTVFVYTVILLCIMVTSIKQILFLAEIIIVNFCYIVLYTLFII